MKVTLNPDENIVKMIKDGLKQTGGYCPCRIEHTEENRCMCKEFKEQINDPDLRASATACFTINPNNRITERRFFMSEIILTQENFEQQVLKSDKTVLVDFWASWCAPCMVLSPVLAEIAQENPDIVVAKANVDEQPGIAFQYGISSIPTLIVFKEGKIATAAVGLRSKEQIVEMLK